MKAESRALWWALRTFAPLVARPDRSPVVIRIPRRRSRAASIVLPPDRRLDESVRWLVRRYLEGFGPASVPDIAQFALLRSGQSLREAHRRAGRRAGPAGGTGRKRVLYDVPGAELIAEETPAPPRLLPMWDSVLLAYADRSRVIPPEYRRVVTRVNGDVLPTLLVDGYVAGVWRPVEGGIEATSFHQLTDETWDGLAVARPGALVGVPRPSRTRGLPPLHPLVAKAPERRRPGAWPRDHRLISRWRPPPAPGSCRRAVSRAQATAIRMTPSGKGSDSASATTASRSCPRQAAPGPERYRPVRASPRPDDLAADEDGTRPERVASRARATICRWDQELTIGAVEQEVGVTARDESDGRAGQGGRVPVAEQQLVRGEDPRVADRRPHRHQGSCQGLEGRAAARCRGIPAHWANAAGVVGPKTCMCRRASSSRASRGSTSGGGTVQTRRLSRTVPPDQHSPGWCRVPQPVRRLAQPAPHLPRMASAWRRGRHRGETRDPRHAGAVRRHREASRARRRPDPVPRRHTR